MPIRERESTVDRYEDCSGRFAALPYKGLQITEE